MKSLIVALSPLLLVVPATAATPVVDVYNAAGMIPAAIQNVAQGSQFVFRFTGTGIGPARRAQAPYPLPASAGLAGLSLQVNVGSAQAYPCILLYAAFEEVGALLPSNVPLGNGQLTLYYTAANGTVTGGPNAQIQVVPVSFGIYANNGFGAGPAVLVDDSGNSVDITNPTHNGATISLRGTGLGKITDDETVPPPRTDLGSDAQVFVGNLPAAILYAGRAGGRPGNDRIDFVVPDGVTGCYVSLWVKAGGMVSNFVSIPIAPPDQSACSDPALGISGADLQPNSAGGLNVGVIGLTAVAGDEGDARFNRFDVDTLIGSPNPAAAPSVGSCVTYAFHGTDPGQLPNFAPSPGLDAGPRLNVSGSNGAKTLDPVAKGFYTARLGGGGGGGRPPYLFPGIYTIDNGGGTADVGPFSISVTLPTPVAWTNLPSLGAIVPRSQDLQVTWSGGEDNDVVIIFAFSVSPAADGLVGEFICAANAGGHQFTVPADVMANLPATILPITAPTAGIAVGTYATKRFTAPGLDFGLVWSLLTSTQIVGFQ